LLAATVFMLGALVYVLDRPAGSAVGLPHLLAFGHGPSFFGALGGNLPSFAHGFAFALLTCLLLPPRRRWLAAACAFWAVVDAGFEVLQLPALAQPLAAALRHAAWPSLETFAAYFANGRFDPLDLLASTLGAFVAFGVAAFVMRRRQTCTELTRTPPP
jgi:hypothetical protein